MEKRFVAVDIEVVVDAHPLEEVEDEQRGIGVGEAGEVGHRARAGDAGVALAQVDLAAVQVG